MGFWHQLANKWFGLSDEPCESCEILREQLHKCDGERVELLHKLLEKDKPIIESNKSEEPIPIKPQFTPWRVRQQMLEQEDRQKMKLMKDRTVEIANLEKELGVTGSSTE